MEDPIPQFSHFVRALKQEFPDLAYIHIIESSGNNTRENDFLREIWRPKPYISAGGYKRDGAMSRTAEKENELVAFGRNFISNVSWWFFDMHL